MSRITDCTALDNYDDAYIPFGKVSSDYKKSYYEMRTDIANYNVVYGNVNFFKADRMTVKSVTPLDMTIALGFIPYGTESVVTAGELIFLNYANAYYGIWEIQATGAALRYAKASEYALNRCLIRIRNGNFAGQTYEENGSTLFNRVYLPTQSLNTTDTPTFNAVNAKNRTVQRGNYSDDIDPFETEIVVVTMTDNNTISNPVIFSGTSVIDGKKITILVKDNGTSYDFSWDSDYYDVSKISNIPTKTIVGKTLFFEFILDSTALRLVCINAVVSDTPTFSSVESIGDVVAGGAYLGNIADGNFTEFEPDGTMRFNGTATTWEDENFDPTMLTGNGNLPTLTTFASTGISIAGFSGSQTDSVLICKEYPHKAILNASGQTTKKLSFHIHCYPTNTTGGNIRLELEYFFSCEGQAITTSQKIYLTETLPSVAWEQKTFTFVDITVPENLGCQYHFKFSRIGGDELDTATQVLAISTIGFHYESDTTGSRQITTK